MLVPNHIDGVVKVIGDQLSLLFVCLSLSAVSVALLTLLPLLVSFSVDDWFIVADIENQISSSRWKNREAGKTRGVRREIQVVNFVLGA